MFKKDESKRNFLTLLKDIEDQLEKVFLAKKSEVEEELREKIRLMKEEAEKTIERQKEEIYQEKKEIKQQLAVITELRNNGAELRNKINRSTDQIVQHKKEILKLMGLQNNGLLAAKDLSQKLDKLQQEADEKANVLKGRLEKKYGIEGKIPLGDVFREKIQVDVSQEIERIGKAIELLEPS